MKTETKKCPYCAEEINVEAIKCKHCSEILDPELKIQRTRLNQPQISKVRKWNPGTATVLSLIIPGAGQMYKGNVGSGLLWLFVVAVGYAFLIVPGLILHLICIVTASSGDPYS